MCTRNENSLPARFIDLYKVIRIVAHSIRLFTFIVILCSCLFSGCAGTGDNSSTNQSQGMPNGSATNQPQVATNDSARAQLTIIWASQSSAQANSEHIKLIPRASNAITITITNSSTLSTSQTVTSQTVSSPGYGNTSTVIFDALPVGTFTVTATAYPDASGTSVAQAKGTATLATQAGQTATLAITMASTIDHLVITSTTTTLPLGSTLPLTVTAYDATGAIVLVGNSYLWQCGTPTIVSVNPDGVLTGDSAVLTGVSAGQTTISVEETESVKTGTITITVPPFIVTPNPAIVTIGTTTQLSVSTTDANGNLIILPLSKFNFTSTAPSIATVGLSSGIVTGVSSGNTVVTATDIYSGKTGTTSITVTCDNALMAGTYQLMTYNGYSIPYSVPPFSLSGTGECDEEINNGIWTFSSDYTFNAVVNITQTYTQSTLDCGGGVAGPWQQNWSGTYTLSCGSGGVTICSTFSTSNETQCDTLIDGSFAFQNDCIGEPCGDDVQIWTKQ